MAMNVRFLPDARDYLEELVTVLYREGYFSWLDSSRRYVGELVDDIRDNLPTRQHRPAPRYFDPDGRGMWMATFRRSHATTWYAFFTKYNDGGETVYLVHRIENNHTAAQHM